MSSRQDDTQSTGPGGIATPSASPAQERRQPRRLSDKAFHYVVDNIVSGKLDPSRRITERELAEALGMSHVPVREAMERLEHEGWIRRTKRGAHVREINLEELEMLYQAREIVETGAVRLIVEAITEEQIEQLAQTTRELERAFRDNDVDGYIAADSAFHISLVRYTGNTRLIPYFESIFRQARYASPVFLFGALRTLFRTDQTLESFEPQSHSAILKAIRDRNGEQAAELLAKHIRNGRTISRIVSGLRTALIE